MSCSCQVGFIRSAGADSSISFCQTSHVCASGYMKYTKETSFCYDLLGSGRSYTAECNTQSTGICCTNSWY